MRGRGGGFGERQTVLEERDGKQRDTGEEKKWGGGKPGEKAGDRGDKRRRR